MTRKTRIEKERSTTKYYKAPSDKFKNLPFDTRRVKYIVETMSGVDSTLKITPPKRNKLALYLGMTIDFNVIYSHKGFDPNGRHVVCVKNIRDPITHEVISDHVWMKVSKSMDEMLTTIKKDSPIHVKAKVITYDNGKKFGLQPFSIRKAIWNDGKIL